MTDEEIQKHKADIDKLSHEEMARLWRFSLAGHPYFEKIMQIFARAQKEWDRIWKGALVRIYLAGKISQNGWRHAIVQDLRDWAFRNIDCDIESTTNWPILIGAIKLGAAGVHDYTGPFFVSCDHGCYHGDNSHGVMGEGIGVCDGPHTSPQEVQDACLRAIDASDLVFAWIEDLTVFGTLIEIGYAIAKRKRVAIAYPEDRRDLSEKLWFAHPGEEALFATSAKHGLIKALGWKGRCS